MHRTTKLRKMLNLNQGEFADLLNISKGNLAMIETGKRKLNSDAAIILARLEAEIQAFNIPEPDREPDPQEAKLISNYRIICAAKITQLEEDLEKRRETLLAKQRLLFLCEKLTETSALPDVGFIYDRLALLKRKNMKAGSERYAAEDKLIRIQIEGLRKSIELCDAMLPKKN
jgi:transcriptional regulator with XRE-family HTH domain